MTEIIPGLQGDLPAKSKNGVPYVGGKYESLPLLDLHYFPVDNSYELPIILRISTLISFLVELSYG